VTPDEPEIVASFSAAAGEYVRRSVGLELDGSEESLAYVDHYLARTREGPPGDDLVPLVAAALGAYFGRVVLARLGGRWVLGGEDPASWEIELPPAPIRFRPVAMAAEALRHAAVPGYDARIQVPPALEGPLADALAAAPPVDEEYYYSLTGRLETLEHAVEVLAALSKPS
jgi:hypothetical protein